MKKNKIICDVYTNTRYCETIMFWDKRKYRFIIVPTCFIEDFYNEYDYEFIKNDIIEIRSK